MIKQSILNYFVNLKYYFTSFGILMSGVVLGIAALIPGLVACVQGLSEHVSDITGGTPLHYLSLFDSLLEAVSRLDWSDPSAALAAFTAPGWLKETLEACIYALVPEGAEYSSEVASAVEGAITRVAACVIVFLILAVLGGMLPSCSSPPSSFSASSGCREPFSQALRSSSSTAPPPSSKPFCSSAERSSNGSRSSTGAISGDQSFPIF